MLYRKLYTSEYQGEPCCIEALIPLQWISGGMNAQNDAPSRLASAKPLIWRGGRAAAGKHHAPRLSYNSTEIHPGKHVTVQNQDTVQDQNTSVIRPNGLGSG
ncbi:hypothetical protein EVAR_80514_1 [Eumeta japonica]|uniref:Uncharacterized protein n=1 Tax=Eumeta variegata TaxID=151549 RepID=A0A4C1TMK5_EUMVA|nr:hypothetical protein EVAR_80514_1 [Eumeta japonica]